MGTFHFVFTERSGTERTQYSKERIESSRGFKFMKSISTIIIVESCLPDSSSKLSTVRFVFDISFASRYSGK